MSCVKCLKLSDISANTAFVIFRVNKYVLVTCSWGSYEAQAVGSKQDVMDLTGGAEEHVVGEGGG
jgi:hypothetical protein